METTRHFTATVYIVNDGATALHQHKRHDSRLPPGGHIDRDELPHEAARREVREETGQVPTLLHDTRELSSAESLPRPYHTLLYDINTCDETVGHQHIDFIYYGTVPTRQIDPDDGEKQEGAWEWYSIADLREERVSEDVTELGTEAIQTAE